jgi:pilus assembly protein CpaB
VSVTLQTQSAVGGLLQPGDRVDILLLQIFGQEPALSPRRAVSETVLTNVRIISIDQRLLPTPMRVADEGPNVRGPLPIVDPRSQRTITVELTPSDAERLLLAAELGRLDFVLRASDIQNAEARDAPPTWADAASRALDPKGRESGQRAVVELPQPITIYRGKSVERLDTVAGGR